MIQMQVIIKDFGITEMHLMHQFVHDLWRHLQLKAICRLRCFICVLPNKKKSIDTTTL